MAVRWISFAATDGEREAVPGEALDASHRLLVVAFDEMNEVAPVASDSPPVDIRCAERGGEFLGDRRVIALAVRFPTGLEHNVDDDRFHRGYRLLDDTSHRGFNLTPQSGNNLPNKAVEPPSDYCVP